MEGKDIRVKMGLAKKEHIEKSVKVVKTLSEKCKRDLRGQRSSMQDQNKKLSKILQKEVFKQYEDSLEKILKKFE